MRVTIAGGGYVGPVSGACSLELGSEAAVIESDWQNLTAPKDRRVPIYELGLDTLIADNANSGRLVSTFACLP